jgi:hypothetical protein
LIRLIWSSCWPKLAGDTKIEEKKIATTLSQKKNGFGWLAGHPMGSWGGRAPPHVADGENDEGWRISERGNTSGVVASPDFGLSNFFFLKII